MRIIVLLAYAVAWALGAVALLLVGASVITIFGAFIVSPTNLGPGLAASVMLLFAALTFGGFCMVVAMGTRAVEKEFGL